MRFQIGEVQVLNRERCGEKCKHLFLDHFVVQVKIFEYLIINDLNYHSNLCFILFNLFVRSAMTFYFFYGGLNEKSLITADLQCRRQTYEIKI